MKTPREILMRLVWEATLEKETTQVIVDRCLAQLEEYYKPKGGIMDKFNPQSMDARKWVKEFNRIEVEKGLQPTDPEWMLGWFANAIMAGYDEAKRRATPLEPNIPEKEPTCVDLNYNCTLAKISEQIGIKLWQAMVMMKYAKAKLTPFEPIDEKKIHALIADLGFDQDCEATGIIAKKICAKFGSPARQKNV